MLTKLLVVGQCVFHLPGRVVAFVDCGRCVVGVVVAREVILLQRSGIVAPERLLCAPSEVVRQSVPNLEVERELRHELMRPVAVGVAVQHGHRVVLLLIRSDEVRDCIRIAGSIGIEVKLRILINLFIGNGAAQRYRQRGSQIEGTTQHRTPSGVGIDACIVNTHVRDVGTQVQLVQEITFVRDIKQVKLVV